MSYTVTYDEKVKGFTSFHSFIPEMMVGMNNDFFSFKDGNLHIHNSENVPRNNFYGEQHTSKVTTIINDESQSDKIFKTVVQESSHPWSVKAKTNYTESELTEQEFNQRESRFYAYLRKSEGSNDVGGHALQGIGGVLSVAGTTITFNEVPPQVSIGDELYYVSGDELLVGTISSFDETTITVSSVTNAPSPGDFAYARKNSRIEGEEMRGYYLELELETTTTEPTELYAVNSKAVKSFI